MAVKTGDLESELIEAVIGRVRERVPEPQTAMVESWVRQYYHWVPGSDLAGRSEDDLYAAAIAHWELAQVRVSHRAKVRVYNPDEDNGDRPGSHTLVDLVSDDMPFIVDSVTMELARQGRSIDLVIHPVIRVRRDAEGRLVEVLEPGDDSGRGQAESILHAEVAREHDPERLSPLAQSMEGVLNEVAAAVGDWQGMRERMLELAGGLANVPITADRHEVEEAQAFLRWVADDHFVFLGYREYDLTDGPAETVLDARPETGMGILRAPPVKPRKALSARAAALARGAQMLVLTKANALATIHRPARVDYIGVKRFAPDGRVLGECRFLGLYTTSAYRTGALTTPLVRDKVRYVLARASFAPGSHDGKALLEILESYPRDFMLQIPRGDLFEIAMGLLGLGERPRLRLFVWADPLDRFVSCLVTFPRDRFNTENRERVGAILREAFSGRQLDFSLQLYESLTVRVNYVVRCPDGVPERSDLPALEERLVRAVRAWTDDLRDALVAEHGPLRGGELFSRYHGAFGPSYRSEWAAADAVDDIASLEDLAATATSIINLYRATDGTLRCKLYSAEGVALSDVLPTFEHMGARVIDERPHRISLPESRSAWIYDFGLRSPAEHADRVREIFQDVFLGAISGEIEDDRLNGLVLGAALPGREILVLRAVARYLRQAGIPYSDAYMERTLLAHPDIARLLVKLFLARFDPEDPNPDFADHLGRAMEVAIDGVQSLDEDRILRAFLSVVRATVRTNYFRQDSPYGLPAAYLSLKLDPAQIPVLPKPRPLFEIFVYSPRFEGVHLRGGLVARGGIRWSDRPEDFRTEILGLMKAQMVKNALIVPVGAKGGFVLKRPPPGGMAEQRQEAIACFRSFLSGLLDLTENIVDGEVARPPGVVRYDGDDPYLVVAADKGTAAFSDIANEVAARYAFWLGDAFASGGSHGYDHKQMGITARGAWESVKRHFRELGTDTQSTDFTVVGIGDMSGDVFGNGMLRSPHIRLVAAFNHRHVFLDPDPDPEAGFAERQRLFDLDRSGWEDYDPALISPGGGVFERTAKSIALSDEVRHALAIEDQELAPAELIRAILRAPVDLLWNGGIGTYVKATDESQADAGDKTNDGLRVNGRELRCRVMGEGGNLGLTQRGRIEYALHGGPEEQGGRINTDAIDNVAGVNCSDHEVNIKILIDAAVAQGRLSQDDRNRLLVEMTGDVAERVLYESYTQTQAISLALAQAPAMIDVHRRVIRRLEQVTGLDRELEFLPSEEVISERKAAHQGLVAPELAVVMAYGKVFLYRSLLDSDLPEDPQLFEDLESYFPPALRERYADLMRSHRLRREIIATVVANQLVDRGGTTFAFRLGEETGAKPAALARGFAVAREVFGMRVLWGEVEALDNQVDAQIQLEMLIEARRLAERSTRWLIRDGDERIEISTTAKRYAPGVELLGSALPEVLEGADREAFDLMVARLVDAGVPRPLSERVASMPSMPAAFDVVAVASATGRSLEDAMRTYFRLGSRLELNWLRDRILDLPRANRWQALARAALREDLLALHRRLAIQVLPGDEATSSDAAIDRWSERNATAVERWLATLADIRASRTYDTTTLPVALREVRRLIQDGDERGGEGAAGGLGRGRDA